MLKAFLSKNLKAIYFVQGNIDSVTLRYPKHFLFLLTFLLTTEHVKDIIRNMSHIINPRLHKQTGASSDQILRYCDTLLYRIVA